MATQVLLRAINVSGKLHMVPAIINDDYVIRFAVCSVNASDDDILYAWNVITETTSTLASQSTSFDLYKPQQNVRTIRPINCSIFAQFEHLPLLAYCYDSFVCVVFSSFYNDKQCQAYKNLTQFAYSATHRP